MAPILQSDAPILECDIHRVPVGFRTFYPYEYIILVVRFPRFYWGPTPRIHVFLFKTRPHALNYFTIIFICKTALKV